MCVLSKINATPKDTLLVFMPASEHVYTQYYFNTLHTKEKTAMIFATNKFVSLEEVDAKSDECKHLKQIANSKSNFTQELKQRFMAKLDEMPVLRRAYGDVCDAVWRPYTITKTANYTCVSLQKCYFNQFMKDHPDYFSTINKPKKLFKDFLDAYKDDDQYIMICRVDNPVKAGVIKLQCEYGKHGVIVPLMHETSWDGIYEMQQRILVHNDFKRIRHLTLAFYNYTTNIPIIPSREFVDTLFENEISKFGDEYWPRTGGTYNIYSRSTLLAHKKTFVDSMLDGLEMPHSILPIFKESLNGSFVNFWGLNNYQLAVLDIKSSVNSDIFI